MRVICIDPGVKTGYCIADERNIYEAGVVRELSNLFKILGGYHPLHGHTSIPAEPISTVVIEQFNRGQQLAEEQIFTIKVIGVVELYVSLNPEVELIYQTPFERKAYIEEAKLYVGRYSCPAEEKPHITDAVAHWLVYRNKKNFAAQRSK